MILYNSQSPFNFLYCAQSLSSKEKQMPDGYFGSNHASYCDEQLQPKAMARTADFLIFH